MINKRQFEDGFYHSLLKIVRKGAVRFHLAKSVSLPEREMDISLSNDVIYELLSSSAPCMIARYGSSELSHIVDYMGVRDEHHSIYKYIFYKMPQYWWKSEKGNVIKSLINNIGSVDERCHYAQLSLDDSKEVDILGSWCKEEEWLRRDGYLRKEIFYTGLIGLEPWWGKRPWSRFLKGKRVLVIHMFKETIEKQYYNHRTDLFPQNPDILPEFASLRIIKSYIWADAISKGIFKDWFDAFEHFKCEMDKEPYDIALIGCGNMGFNLAAYAKRTGHQAVHLGGALQLLFGIKGHRWETLEYGKVSLGRKNAYVDELYNESWCYPKKSEVASLASVEHGCYVQSVDSKF